MPHIQEAKVESQVSTQQNYETGQNNDFNEMSFSGTNFLVNNNNSFEADTEVSSDWEIVSAYLSSKGKNYEGQEMSDAARDLGIKEDELVAKAKEWAKETRSDGKTNAEAYNLNLGLNSSTELNPQAAKQETTKKEKVTEGVVDTVGDYIGSAAHAIVGNSVKIADGPYYSVEKMNELKKEYAEKLDKEINGILDFTATKKQTYTLTIGKDKYEFSLEPGQRLGDVIKASNPDLYKRLEEYKDRVIKNFETGLNNLEVLYQNAKNKFLTTASVTGSPNEEAQAEATIYNQYLTKFIEKWKDDLGEGFVGLMPNAEIKLVTSESDFLSNGTVNQ